MISILYEDASQDASWQLAMNFWLEGIFRFTFRRAWHNGMETYSYSENNHDFTSLPFRGACH